MDNEIDLSELFGEGQEPKEELLEQDLSEFLQMRTVYLSGPMTGVELFNRPAFHHAEEMIHLNGLAGEKVRVINPARNFGGSLDREYEEYMNLSLMQVHNSDVVVLLEGYEHSNGVKREVELAKELGLEFYTLVRHKLTPIKPEDVNV